ncbi:MAG: rhomboid family intrarane serine protease [Schumannella sp.]|nr:rhomboid family intrarane serine protease [Schumannella sp.]
MPGTQAETDPSVCYRHPDRSSWTLCARCGRTICPECQILTPAGVRCPDCVRETGGSVRWESTAAPRAAKAKKTGMRPARASQLAGAVSATTYPVIAIGSGAVAVILWITGFFTGNWPFTYLAAVPPFAAEVWRYVTTSVAYPALSNQVIGTVLSIGIWVYFAWGAERQFGRRRFFGLFLVTGSGAAAIAMLAGGYSFGLSGAIWGIAGAYLITVWSHAAARNRLLISLGIWFVLSLFVLGNVFAVLGGALSGIGAMLLLRYYDDRARTRPWVPYVILAGAIVLIVILAILRSVALS